MTIEKLENSLNRRCMRFAYVQDYSQGCGNYNFEHKDLKFTCQEVNSENRKAIRVSLFVDKDGHKETFEQSLVVLSSKEEPEVVDIIDIEADCRNSILVVGIGNMRYQKYLDELEACVLDWLDGERKNVGREV